jgi:hypothetical protein
MFYVLHRFWIRGAAPRLNPLRFCCEPLYVMRSSRFGSRSRGAIRGTLIGILSLTILYTAGKSTKWRSAAWRLPQRDYHQAQLRPTSSSTTSIVASARAGRPPADPRPLFPQVHMLAKRTTSTTPSASTVTGRRPTSKATGANGSRAPSSWRTQSGALNASMLERLRGSRHRTSTRHAALHRAAPRPAHARSLGAHSSQLGCSTG